ncbi:MAG: FMN-binding negative transcriptional regulator [Sphingobium sp.]
MHPTAAFHWQDRDAMRAFVAERSFGALFAMTPEGPRVAHVPVIWQGDDRIAFHLARGNALTAHLDGVEALFTAQGPDAYVSPDWYGLDDQVPTWNYIAVELQGQVRREPDDALLPLIDALSAEHERRLAPKSAWTRAKMRPGSAEKMMRGIAAFTLSVTDWRGTRKLNQNKPEAARLAVADAMDALGQADMAQELRHI